MKYKHSAVFVVTDDRFFACCAKKKKAESTTCLEVLVNVLQHMNLTEIDTY